jgi:nitrous oxidase accessory protein NosD
MHFGVNNLNTNANTFSSNYFANCTAAISIVGSTNNLVLSNTFENAPLAFSYSGSNTVAKNNFINSTIIISFSMPPTVDMNYWSEYTAKYPDAQEIGDLGMWNTPYVINEHTQDNYPLTSPVKDPSGVAPAEASFPTLTIAAGAVTVVFVAFLIVYTLKHKKK